MNVIGQTTSPGLWYETFFVYGARELNIFYVTMQCAGRVLITAVMSVWRRDAIDRALI